MRKNKNKSDVKNRIILNQIDKIDKLEKTICELKISCEEKEKVIKSINSIRDDLFMVINELKKKSNEYDVLTSDLIQMRKVMNQTVFKGRWKLIRLLLK
ncbi:MAG: hypothetical protein IKW51_09000 [Bacteroidales bacterium]|nr:hypothetical protein [Bacteroidales bacterium]